jgi:hypothetical protein
LAWRRTPAGHQYDQEYGFRTGAGTGSADANVDDVIEANELTKRNGKTTALDQLTFTLAPVSLSSRLSQASCSGERNGFGPRVVFVDPPPVGQLAAGAVVTGAVSP